MIKLNNKNITYVALADSSNSIKAPKEIWYADSANSVKLVYRRKDALIEGEDYEKYHWLVGDADAYINTLKYYRPYDDSVQMTFRDNLYPNRVSKRNKYNVEEQIWGTSINTIHIRSYISGSTATDITIGNNILDSNTSESGITWGNYTIDGTINDSEQHSIYISSVNNENKYSFTHNGTEKNNLSTRYTLPEIVQDNVYVFYNKGVTNGYFNGSFFNFIHYRNNVEITHLIPCKLLKPVPKWLDANGIRRQVGECGMIDLVSGKFYGNVNSVGTFTVENYYERKKWLIGDGSAYIDTNITEVNQNAITLNAIIDVSIYNQALFGAEDTTVNPQKRVFVRYSVNKLIIYDNNPSRQVATDTIVNLVFSDDGNVYLNGDEVTTYSSPLSLTDSVLLFAAFLRNSQGTSIQNSTNMKVSHFSISSKINLIPCTLTMDLPASMDANNIARTKGTSGMWDLVSDRFYGNVANSGTFKAVNLAEGVDYEVHQWLKTEVAVEARRMMQLPIHSYSFSFSRKIISGTNVPYFYTEGGAPANVYLNTTNLHTITIWNNVQDIYYKSGQSFDRNDAISIVSSTDGLVVNSQTIPQNAFPAQAIYFGANDNNGTENYTSSITVDGIERYIPVKLLRSIPAKYDANGIARQAGECGMYDTVNDKFYGNVASSGTFSVSDDE